MSDKYVLVKDGSTSWIAEKSNLIAELDAQGWEKRWNGFTDERWEPESPEDGPDAYTELCMTVPEHPEVDESEVTEEFRLVGDYTHWEWSGR